MDKYITREELRLAPYNIAIDKADNKYLEVLQEITKNLVDSFCGQEFDLEGTDLAPVEKKVNGTGADTVFLPKRIVGLKKIRIYTDIASYDEHDPTSFVVSPKFVSWNMFADTGSYNPRMPYELFPQGNANIGVVATWGYAAVPNQIKYLQGKMIKKMVEDETYAERFQSESIGDYSMSLAGDAYPITGDREMDLIIKNYRTWIHYVAV